MKILCVGHATYDITLPIDEFIKENTKNRIYEKIECGGGPACTAAYLLGKWGSDVYFAGLIGNDYYGLKIKEELSNANVNTNYMEINNDIITPTSFILANKKNGSRTILTYKKNKNEMQNCNLNFMPDALLIDGQECKISKKILKEFPNCLSIIDASRDTPEIVELCKLVKWVVCSKDFAEKITNIKIDYNDLSILNNVYKKLKEIFNNNIIITLEEKGCFYDNQIIKSIKLKSIDSTGAGDIFHGAFTYYLTNGYEPINAIKLANYAGAISVSKIGTRNSIPTKEEMEAVYNEFK